MISQTGNDVSSRFVGHGFPINVEYIFQVYCEPLTSYRRYLRGQ
jgi:hypothetical protein